MPVRWARWGRTASRRWSLFLQRLASRHPLQLSHLARRLTPCVGFSGCPQFLDLGLAQAPRLSLPELPQPEAPEADPLQRHHPVADRLDHPADLAVAAFAEDDLDLAVAEGADLRRGG